MYCNRCNKSGATPYTYKDGGTAVEIFLCEDCYRALSGSAPQVSVNTGGGLLKMQRRCPSCNTALSDIRRSGYIGCAECFRVFKNELIPVIDRLQNNIISAPEKKQREMSIILLESEYCSLSVQTGRNPAETSRICARMREIENRLSALGVNIDE